MFNHEFNCACCREILPLSELDATRQICSHCAQVSSEMEEMVDAEERDGGER